MVTKGEMRSSFVKFFHWILKENVWRPVWRICIWILDLIGSKVSFLCRTCAPIYDVTTVTKVVYHEQKVLKIAVGGASGT